MLEDQVSPKRCGHTGVKEVVARDVAIQRISAAVEARRQGADLVIVALVVPPCSTSESSKVWIDSALGAGFGGERVS